MYANVFIACCDLSHLSFKWALNEELKPRNASACWKTWMSGTRTLLDCYCFPLKNPETAIWYNHWPWWWCIVDWLLGRACFLTACQWQSPKEEKAGHLSYCSWSVYVSLEDALFRKSSSALNCGQLFNRADEDRSRLSSGWERERGGEWWEQMSFKCDTIVKIRGIMGSERKIETAHPVRKCTVVVRLLCCLFHLRERPGWLIEGTAVQESYRAGFDMMEVPSQTVGASCFLNPRWGTVRIQETWWWSASNTERNFTRIASHVASLMLCFRSGVRSGTCCCATAATLIHTGYTRSHQQLIMPHHFY